jgi:hypothetical protein
MFWLEVIVNSGIGSHTPFFFFRFGLCLMTWCSFIFGFCHEKRKKNWYPSLLHPLQHSKRDKYLIFCKKYSHSCVPLAVCPESTLSPSQGLWIWPQTEGNIADFPWFSFQVSWIRLRDWHILSTDETTFTKDERFQVLHAPDQRDWTLGTPNSREPPHPPPTPPVHNTPWFLWFSAEFDKPLRNIRLNWDLVAVCTAIKYVTRRDEGTYVCQVGLYCYSINCTREIAGVSYSTVPAFQGWLEWRRPTSFPT